MRYTSQYSNFSAFYRIVCASTIISTAMLTACSKQDVSPNSGSSSSNQDERKQSEGWIKHESASADGSIQVSESRISKEQLALVRNQYRRVNMIQLPVDGSYNVNIFKMTDGTIEEYRNKVFVAPKLFSYGTQQGGKLAPMLHPNHTVTISFNVAFVDGSVKKIQSPSADEQLITLPDSFIVQNKEKLLADLSSVYGATNGISALPGCPKKITLIANGKEYDATPDDLARGDFCQVNVPTTVSLTVPEDEAQSILEEGLYSGTVDVRGIYETKVSVPVSKVHISFNRSKIFEDLRAELSVNIGYVDADVTLALTKVMQNQMMKVSIQGDQSVLLSSLVAKATGEFFEALLPDPVTGTKPCGSAPVCLRLNYTSQTQSSTFDFDWVQETNDLIGQNYITSTKLKPTPKKVTLGGERGCKSNCGRVINNGEARATGLTVVSGNKIIIEPDYIIQESHEATYAKPYRQDNNVCIASHQECSDECHGYHCMNVNTLKEVLSCNTVCDRYENRWSMITNYSLGRTKDVTVENPVGNLDEFYEGIHLAFTWVDAITQKKMKLECPLEVFPREGNGRQMAVRLQNVPTCQPFSSIESEIPELSLVNRISMPETYLEGRKVELWNGNISEMPVKKLFEPRIEFVGNVSIQGYSFMSSSSKIQF